MTDFASRDSDRVGATSCGAVPRESDASRSVADVGGDEPYEMPVGMHRFFEGPAQPIPLAAVAASTSPEDTNCCPAIEEETCCEPSDEAGCCGASTEGGCGCRRRQGTLAR